MSRLKVKFINYSPDFKNESLINRSKKLFDKIKTKNIIGFENFGFHELALNFNQDNLKELTLFSNKFHVQNIRNVIVFCSSNDIMNFNSGYSFLYRNDILEKYKIKYHFINNDEADKYPLIYEKIEDVLLENSTAFLFVGLVKYNSVLIEFIKLILNQIQQKHGYYRALKRCFFIGKENLEKQLEFIEIEEKNKIIMPNILTENYSFFAESNLFLLLLLGCDIYALMEGYQSGCRLYNSENLTENIAFQYAFVRHSEKQNCAINMLTADDKILTNSLVLQTYLNNSLFIKEGILSTYYTFPSGVYTYGQYIIDNSKKLYLTYYELESEKFDYRLTEELNNIDNLNTYGIQELSKFKKNQTYGTISTLTNIAAIPCCNITIRDNSEISLAALIGFMYWSVIYESYLDEINPFEK